MNSRWNRCAGIMKKEMWQMNIKDLKTFEDRYNYDVKKLGMVEKKGKFDYLSWAYAQKLAKIFDEKCTWRIGRV